MVTSFLKEAARGEAPPLMSITVGLYHQMIDSGILHDGGPIELIDGLLVRKDRTARGENLMGHNPRHAALVARVAQWLTEWSRSCGCHVRTQLPVTLTDVNEPEPDVALIQGPDLQFSTRHPGPDDLTLVIEVADSSVSIDRSTKQRLYATAGIPVYWIVNIPDALVEVYEHPDAASGKYLPPTIYRAGQTVRFSLAGQTIDIDVTRLFA